MKRIFRMLIFTAIAIYITSLWNKGFLIDLNIKTFTQATLIVAVIYYLIYPLSKIVLLPLNFLSLGLVSLVVYFLLFYFLFARYNLVEIRPWVFSGISILGFTIQKTSINYFFNVILSSLSISFIINFLGKIL